MIGTELTASFINKEQHAYSFQTVVTVRVKEKIPLLSITYPGDHKLNRIQRREYVRVETTLDVAVHPLENEFLPFKAVTTDISAGGAALLIPKSTILNQGQEVVVWFSLPFHDEEIDYIKVRGKILRFIQVENERFYKVPLQFFNIDELTRQKLIRFCFQQQIIMRRKGLMAE